LHWSCLVLIGNARINFGVSCVLVLRKKITSNYNFSSCFRLSWYLF